VGGKRLWAHAPCGGLVRGRGDDRLRRTVSSDVSFQGAALPTQAVERGPSGRQVRPGNRLVGELLGDNDPEVKAITRLHGEAAVAPGVFFSPWIFVDGEPFWGSDRLAMIERWLSTGPW